MFYVLTENLLISSSQSPVAEHRVRLRCTQHAAWRVDGKRLLDSGRLEMIRKQRREHSSHDLLFLEPSVMCCSSQKPSLAVALGSCLACISATSKGVKYLCIPAADSPSQNLTRHFRESIKFIHECRLGGEGCLVHCLAGVSRSVTLVVAYIMTVTDFGWEDALHTVRAGRSCANPNLGFQRQLQEFEKHQVHQFRQWLREEYGENPLRDAEAARSILAVLSPHGEQPHVRPLPLSSCAPPCRLPLAARASLRGLHAPRSWKKERFWAPSRFPLEYAFKSP
ncbi:dual specificity protein phosphatase 22 isoform X10 [Camelus dromedarius]|uniref:dual specificity protein phosphatase 22 isoform X10 n=1 Tax=Camelus dromedarius TaxID=9838 RepID=UPI003119A634